MADGSIDPAKSDDGRGRALANELRWIAERRLDETFKDPNRRDDEGKLDVEKFRLTAEIVKNLLSDEWERNPSGALRQVVRAAIERLPEDYSPRNTKITGRRMAMILYGFIQVTPGGDRRRPNYKEDYIPLAERESKFYGGNFSRPTGELRSKIAIQMLALTPEDLSPRSGAEFSQSEPSRSARAQNPWYVERPELQRSIVEALRGGARIVVLIGQAGVGKTALAQAVTATADGRPVPLIRVVAREISTIDLTAALVDGGFDIKPGQASRAEREYLTHFLTAPTHPSVVILDNLDSADELHHLLPRRFEPQVIVTCRSRGSNPPEGCVFINVGTLAPEEAAQAVQVAVLK